MKHVTIVTPTYNEEDNVHEVYRQVKEVFAQLPQYSYDHLFIDNASKDKTPQMLRELAGQDPNVRVILNAGNFGHIRSPYHAMLQADGDAVVPFVADLQDPPELLPELIAKWEEGYKIVAAIKTLTDEPFVIKHIRRLYYRMLSKISDAHLITDFTGFGLYDRKVMDLLRQIDDPYPYFRGLITELGYPAAFVPYRQPARRRGITKNNMFTLFDMAMLGMTKHSRAPLRMATLFGFLMAGMSLIISVIYLVMKLVFWDRFEAGVAPLLIGIYFFGSVQIFFIGILGEYVGSIQTQVRHLPLVVELERINFNCSKPQASSSVTDVLTPPAPGSASRPA